MINLGKELSSRVLILDFGSQYTQLIARRVRELRVYCEIHPWKVKSDFVTGFSPSCIILSGGPETAGCQRSPQLDLGIFALGVPMLGICYGMQTMASQLGGRVEASGKREFGHARVTTLMGDPLFADTGAGEEGTVELDVWMSHGDQVLELPHGFECLAKSKDAGMAAIVRKDQNLYGLQFHPEVEDTQFGKKILENFVIRIASSAREWQTEKFLHQAVEKIRSTVGKDEVILGLSGGVDSSVAAVLIHRAIGKQLHCVFVDNGLLRDKEAEEVRQTFSSDLAMTLHCVDARQRFLDALSGVEEPEEKRKIIGNLFVKVFEEKAEQLGDIQWLAQGTIYPDVVESAKTGSGATRLIKSHHNVGGLPEKMRLKLLEPLASFFKDEVREIGHQLGLPDSRIHRHPFPGPGLAVRIMGAVDEEKLARLRQADRIFIEVLRNAGLYGEVAQAFVVLLPVKSVAVMGDDRYYGNVLVLRAVETVDFMTARWARLPLDLLADVAGKIVNEVRGVSRVCYDLGNKPPATIEWE